MMCNPHFYAHLDAYSLFMETLNINVTIFLVLIPNHGVCPRLLQTSRSLILTPLLSNTLRGSWVYVLGYSVFVFSDRRSEPLREPRPSSEAGWHKSVRHGVRRTARRHRLLSSRRPQQTPLSEPPAVYHHDHRRRLLHEHRTGQ